MSTFIQISSSGSSGGRFGIADSSGTYTYYTTLTAAMTAAVAGQTIEMFTDYTETLPVTITLKNGVNINGNGHTYTLSTLDTTHAFVIADGVSNFDVNILNTIIKRTNATGTNGSCILVGFNSEGKLNLEGSVLINTGAGQCIGPLTGNANVRIYNANAISNSANAITVTSNDVNMKLVNCTAVSFSQSGILVASFCDVIDCRGESTSSNGITSNQGNVINSIGKSVSGNGIRSNGATLLNSTGISSSGAGISVFNSGNLYDSTGISSANIGIRLDNSDLFTVKGCQAISSSSVGFYFNGSIAAHVIYVYDTISTSTSSYAFSSGNGSIVLYNCSAESLAFPAVAAANSLYNCVVNSKWNNAAGHSVSINTANQIDIVNSTLIVTNASANAIYKATPVTVSYSHNSFKGATTPINANITQGMINTDDAYGNITI
jgi:hypothetical protein